MQWLLYSAVLLTIFRCSVILPPFGSSSSSKCISILENMLTSALRDLSFKVWKTFHSLKSEGEAGKKNMACTKTLFIISTIWHQRHKKVSKGPSPCCSAAVNQKTSCSCLFRSSGHWEMNKMKNFKRRFSLSVPRTETIEENEFTEQINQLNIQRNEGKRTSDTHRNSLHTYTDLLGNYFITLFSFSMRSPVFVFFFAWPK